jgi:peptide/nickel transport system permease protein
VDPAHQPPGCAYAPRCPLASARCREEDPDLADDGTGRRVACWHAGETAAEHADVPGAVPVALTTGARTTGERA